MSLITTIGYFLFSVFFSLLITLFWFKAAICFFRIDPRFPLCRLVDDLTKPLFLLMGNTPLAKKNKRRDDVVCLGVIFVLELFKFSLLNLLFLSVSVSWLTVLLLAAADFIMEPCNLMFYALLIRAILSWIIPQWHNPMAVIIYAVTEPLLCQCRRLLPQMLNIDLSPLLAMILLKVITLFISSVLPFGLI